jgi:hypothetical protein
MVAFTTQSIRMSNSVQQVAGRRSQVADGVYCRLLVVGRGARCCCFLLFVAAATAHSLHLGARPSAGQVLYRPSEKQIR